MVGEGGNGREVIELYRNLNPDLVTMGITMPNMSWLDAVKEIKKKFQAAKVIMCSAMGQQKLVVEG